MRAIALVLLLPAIAHALPITYDLGPFTSTTGDVLTAEIAIDGSSIDDIKWEVNNGEWGGQSAADSAKIGIYTVSGNALFLTTGGIIGYTTYANGQTSPVIDNFVVKVDAGGFQIFARQFDHLSFHSIYHGSWQIDTSLPAVIATAPEPSTLALTALAALCFGIYSKKYAEP